MHPVLVSAERLFSTQTPELLVFGVELGPTLPPPQGRRPGRRRRAAVLQLLEGGHQPRGPQPRLLLHRRRNLLGLFGRFVTDDDRVVVRLTRGRRRAGGVGRYGVGGVEVAAAVHRRGPVRGHLHGRLVADPAAAVPPVHHGRDGEAAVLGKGQIGRLVDGPRLLHVVVDDDVAPGRGRRGREGARRCRRRRGLAAALPLRAAGLLVGLGAVDAAVDEAPPRKEGAAEQADPAIFAREAPLVGMPVLAFVRHLTCGGFDVYALLPAMLCYDAVAAAGNVSSSHEIANDLLTLIHPNGLAA